MQTNLFEDKVFFEEISEHNEKDKLFNRFKNKISINPLFTRALVSFQENKNEPFYRWLKFKESFSSKLVRFIIDQYVQKNNKELQVLDPFAGIGTTVSTAVKKGFFATGIEMLPVGITVMKARKIADSVDLKKFRFYLDQIKKTNFHNLEGNGYHFPHLRITQNAFPPETEKAIESYFTFLDQVEDKDTRFLFWFACFSILEDISYTSKDGQYLRWDFRSGRKLRSKYKKRVIREFNNALFDKLEMMFEDLKQRNGGGFSKKAKIIEGSCINELPEFETGSIDLVVTSPPYCNRYDYTRTYALELAFLGLDEKKVKDLRQNLLFSTVENKPKQREIFNLYSKLRKQEFFNWAINGFEKQQALNEILSFLNDAKKSGDLNNNNIPVLVENYFWEMNLVIHELARILSPKGRIFMVNDNVQYAGKEVPVDLILSDFAEHAGLNVDKIWILSKGKGNSSQQMGNFGRHEIRKCIYVWSKE